MRFSLRLQWDLFRYIARQKAAGRQHFPLVLMLEPLHACNLACAGCGRIVEYESTYHAKLSLSQALAAVDECGAPVVSVCGGEPLLWKPLFELLAACFERGRHVQLCTNGILLDRFMERVAPHANLTLQVHLDGLRETHDRVVCKEGVFDTVVPQMKRAIARGYRVCTNTTIYRETTDEELAAFFAFLDEMGVHGFDHAGLRLRGVDNDIYMRRDEVQKRLAHPRAGRQASRALDARLSGLPRASAISTTRRGRTSPTTRAGWKGPCYFLITDAHYETHRELVEKTDWEYFEAARSSCANCQLHSGFEPSAAEVVSSEPRETLRFLRWVVR